MKFIWCHNACTDSLKMSACEVHEDNIHNIQSLHISDTIQVPRDTMRIDDVIDTIYTQLQAASLQVPKYDIEFIKQQLFFHKPVPFEDINPIFQPMVWCMQHIIVDNVHPKTAQRGVNPEIILFDTHNVHMHIHACIAKFKASE